MRWIHNYDIRTVDKMLLKDSGSAQVTSSTWLRVRWLKCGFLCGRLGCLQSGIRMTSRINSSSSISEFKGTPPGLFWVQMRGLTRAQSIYGQRTENSLRKARRSSVLLNMRTAFCVWSFQKSDQGSEYT